MESAKMTLMEQTFQKGLKDGIPIGLGYFAVSMAYGMAAIVQGMTVTQIIMISLTNLTSAGQFAGTTLLAVSASLIEIAITLIVINSRYFLMGLSLLQKMQPGIPLYRKMMMAFGITDEIYAVAMGQKGDVTFSYFMGLMVLPIAGWTAGTALGGIASSLLPSQIVNALGIAMYGMFIAIFVPAARMEKPVMICVLLSIAASCLFAWIPGLNSLSPGYSVVLIAVAVCAFCAWKFPRKEPEDD
ncbi:MAG: AzlC family ABC transporter permease [Ileibacterium sp.]|nr:AzlC family ABC transporter permease [Ileibacterium sp.]